MFGGSKPKPPTILDIRSNLTQDPLVASSSNVPPVFSAGGGSNGRLGIRQTTSQIEQWLYDAAGGKYNIDKPIRVADRGKYVKDTINKIPFLKHWFERHTNRPNIYTSSNKVNEQPHFNSGGSNGGFIQLTDDVFEGGDRRLVGVLLHEFYHSFQFTFFRVDELIKAHGSVDENTIGESYLEVEAYEFAIGFGHILTPYGETTYKRHLKNIGR